MKVKIIAVPPGGAPTDIRQQWVGLELPLEEGPKEPGILRSTTGGAPNPRSMGGYPVKTEDAIQALRTAEREHAAEWWETWYLETQGRGKTLVFARDVCELVEEGGETTVVEPRKHVAAMTAANRR